MPGYELFMHNVPALSGLEDLDLVKKVALEAWKIGAPSYSLVAKTLTCPDVSYAFDAFDGALALGRRPPNVVFVDREVRQIARSRGFYVGDLIVCESGDIYVIGKRTIKDFIGVDATRDMRWQARRAREERGYAS